MIYSQAISECKPVYKIFTYQSHYQQSLQDPQRSKDDMRLDSILILYLRKNFIPSMDNIAPQ